MDSHVETLVVIYVGLPFSWPLGLRQGSFGRQVEEGIWLPRTGNGVVTQIPFPLVLR